MPSTEEKIEFLILSIYLGFLFAGGIRKIKALSCKNRDVNIQIE